MISQNKADFLWDAVEALYKSIPVDQWQGDAWFSQTIFHMNNIKCSRLRKMRTRVSEHAYNRLVTFIHKKRQEMSYDTNRNLF